jgi:hypothetical protein
MLWHNGKLTDRHPASIDEVKGKLGNLPGRAALRID